MTRRRRPRRLYAYSDQTGQDSRGEFFIVVTIVIDGDRDEIVAWLEQAEGANRGLRGVSRDERELKFIDKLPGSGRFYDAIFFSMHRDTTVYRSCTMTSVRRALDAKAPERDYEADITVDGLTESDRRLFAKELRGRGVPIHKVRGARDESRSGNIRRKSQAPAEIRRKYGRRHRGSATGISWHVATKFARPKSNFVAWQA